jgi:hypothetical protein
MLSSMWLLALTIGLLIVASAFFSSAETALTATSDARMRQLTNKCDKRAKIVEKLQADRIYPDWQQYSECSQVVPCHQFCNRLIW